jgi:hypothetical protein
MIYSVNLKILTFNYIHRRLVFYIDWLIDLDHC